MKKCMAIALAVIALGGFNAAAFDPKDLLNGLKSALGGSGEATETNTETDNTGSNTGGGILGAIGGFINNTLANNNFTVDDLIGTWDYVSPAVSFASDNALKKIGGAGAATALEGKLEPYYNQLGFNNTVFTVADDHSFVLKMGLISLSGEVEKADDGMLEFNFSAFGKVPLGKVRANATKAGSTLNLTFDATKLIQILTKVSSVLNNTTLKTLSSLLSSYDGVYMGFKLQKEA